MKKTVSKEFYVGLAMIVVAMLGWFAAIPSGIDLPQSVQFAALSPDFWPRIIMVLLGLCGAIVALQAHMESRGAATGDAETEDENGLVEHPLQTRMLRVLFGIACLFAFYFAITHLGVIISSTLVVLALTISLGQRTWKHVLPLALLLPVLLYYFFVYVAQVPMPLGMFESWR